MPDSSNTKKSYDIDTELAKGIHYHQSEQLQQAEEIYKEILSKYPNHGDACHLLGFLSLQKGNNELAAGLINKAIKIDPDSPLYNNSLGLVFSALGQHEKAIASYQTALENYPNYTEVYRNLGHTLLELGKYQEAAASYQQALNIDPENAELLHHLGRVMEELGNHDEAIICYRQTLEIAPQNADACNDLGLILRLQGKISEALSYFRKAVEIKPGCAEAHLNLGIILQDRGGLEAAGECYRKAIAEKPDFAKAHSNLGMAYQGMGKSAEAVACFRKAIEIQPDYASAYRHLVHQLQKDCCWSEMAAPAARLDQLTKASLKAGDRPAEDPFLNLTRHPESAYNLAVARAWSTDIIHRITNLKSGFSFDNRLGNSKPINIGYLSNNFHDHPMAHLLLGLFGLHDRNQFKINCYSCGKQDDSYYRQRIRHDCDKFIDLRSSSHLEAAQTIYNDQVDILVDLMGHTRGSRMEICALRPAPIQVRYLGQAGTSGAKFFDYILTDNIVTPETYASYYTENFAYLPHCYQINSYQQAMGDEFTAAGDDDLPDNRFVFCSFNQDYKIEPVIFKSWMRILRSVPDSILWLMVRHQAAKKHLRREANKQGLNPDRLIFLERQPKAQHLKRLKRAGLALDTRVVNGAATTSDALWAGLPVITIKGTHFASRMSGSILTAVGLPELIAHSIEEYEAIAVQLATNRDRLAKLRQKLAKNRLTEPLFDTPRFVTNLEKAYCEMWQIFEAGLKPRQIEVIESNSRSYENIKQILPTAKPVKSNKLDILFVQEFPCIRNYKMAKALTSKNVSVSLAYSKARLSQIYKDISDDVYSECLKITSFRHLWDISNNYDIVHCHNEPDIFTVAALAGDTPVVHDTHDLIFLRSGDDQNLSYFEGIANRGAQGRIYSTSYQMAEAERLYGIVGPSIVFYNYASADDLPTRILAKRSESDGQIHIVYEGGIGGSTHRDFSTIFPAIAKLGFHIHIYPTAYDAKITDFFSKYPTIHFHRPVSPKQIIQEMTQYDFGIIPFNLDKGNRRFLDSTIANKLFEYLAAGLPVITSSLKSYVNFFKENPVGITIEKPPEIVYKLDRLKHISAHTDFSKYIFTYEREIDRIIDLYQDVINK